MSDSNNKEIIEKVKAEFGDSVLEDHNFRNDQTVTVKKETLREVCKFLRDTPGISMKFLMDITAVDYHKKKPVRFEVVYHFYSLEFNSRFRLKVPVGEKECEIDSIHDLWKASNWYEREIWDLYGVKFLGHPDLRRILMYEGFKGHPLRKDYPINKRQPMIGPLN